MPAELTYPGVYVEEPPSSVRPIIGVGTSTTAFVGRARKGPVDKAVRVYGYADYDRAFGGLWDASRMSFAVRQFFQNGGREAIVVRVTRNAAEEALPSTWALPGPAGELLLEASSPGSWGDQVEVAVDHTTAEPGTLFNLVVRDGRSGEEETLRNLSLQRGSRSFVTAVLEQRSRLLSVAPDADLPAEPPAEAKALPGAGGQDGDEIRDLDLMPENGQGGVRALGAAGAFNLLCLPPLSESTDVDPATYRSAVTYLQGENRPAIVIVDPPSGTESVEAAIEFQEQLNLPDAWAALFYPRLLAPNPLKGNLVEEFAPCGAVAGVIARTDAQRGVWKAAAGTEARIAGVDGLTHVLTDKQNGALNPLGVNCIRRMPQIGTVIWGSRTLRGADALADQWKHVPVRRTAFHIEESLQRGLSWVVFEPNDEPLWAQIRLNAGAFMNGLFRQGAFQGTTPAQAYFVKCDAETTVQDDIDRGVVNVLIGFAPLKPAEFVVLKIQQIAGQGAA